MPVKKSKKPKKAKTMLDRIVPDVPDTGLNSVFIVGEHMRRLFLTLFTILLIYIIIWFATLIRNNLQEFNYIGQADQLERLITVEAEETVVAKPDVVGTTIGMRSRGDTVEQAQQLNTQVMNQLVERLKEMGVSEDDIQTRDYNVFPRYIYRDGEQIEDGFEVSQHIRVTCKDTQKANKVLALAGELGANSVSGLEFTIDDPEVYREQARNIAIAKARIKARRLANSLGVQLVGIVSYDEYEGGQEAYPYRSFYAEDAALGGSIEPDIQEGTQDVTVSVTIAYQIR